MAETKLSWFLKHTFFEKIIANLHVRQSKRAIAGGLSFAS